MIVTLIVPIALIVGFVIGSYWQSERTARAVMLLAQHLARDRGRVSSPNTRPMSQTEIREALSQPDEDGARTLRIRMRRA